MLRKVQTVWESISGKSAKDLHASASYQQLEVAWSRLAPHVPGALSDTDAALRVAKDVTASGEIAFPAFLRISTHLPWYHLVLLDNDDSSEKDGAAVARLSGGSRLPPTPPVTAAAASTRGASSDARSPDRKDFLGGF